MEKESKDNQVHRLESDVNLDHNHIPMLSNEKKIGRNEKIKMITPDGKTVEVKFKKIESYLSKGYQLSNN